MTLPDANSSQPELDWHRLRQLFTRARSLSPDDREAFLNAETAGDPLLQKEVESLLAHSAGETDFLGTPAFPGELFDPEQVLAVTEENHAAEPSATELPERIGPYVPRELLGEGGMGAVYLAEQREPIHRLVALKLIRRGLDGRQVISRFRAELQVLARLQHPNVARVYDAGDDEMWGPYIVMEYVAGPSILAACEGVALETKLRLFVACCQAISHCHLRGVIHRDIKPSNLLVERVDGIDHPKVIDFGVAKARFGNRPEATSETRPGQLIGTPDYASPEQLGAAPDVDVRSDVYSLGVVLHKLVTGQLPAPPEDVGITRSVSLGIAGESLSAGARRDLEAMLGRALATDREDRYPSVREFAEDLERFLRGDPVEARLGPLGERLQRSVRRHRVTLAVSGAMIVGLLVGFEGLRRGLGRANKAEAKALSSAKEANASAEEAIEARREARLAEQEARNEAGAAEEIVQFLLELIESAGPTAERRDAMTTLALVDQASARIREDFPDQPMVRARLSLAMSRVQSRLGRYDLALELAEEALETLTGMGTDASLLIVEAHFLVAFQSFNAARLEAAADACHRGLQALEELEPESGLKPQFYLCLARTQVAGGDGDSAKQSLRFVFDRFDELSDPLKCDAWEIEGRVRAHAGQFAKALDAHDRALELSGRNRSQSGSHQIEPHLGRAEALLRLGRLEEASASAQEAHELQLRHLGEWHPDRSRALILLARADRRQGNLEDAKRRLQTALELVEDSRHENHPHLATVLSDLAQVSFHTGEFEEALDTYDRILEIFEANPKVIPLDYLGGLMNRASVLLLLGEVEFAVDEFRAVRDQALDELGEQHPLTHQATLNLAMGLSDLEEYEEAFDRMVEALDGLRRQFPAHHPHVVKGITRLAWIELHRGNPLDAQREAQRVQRLLPASGNSWPGRDDVVLTIEQVFEAVGAPEPKRDSLDDTGH